MIFDNIIRKVHNGYDPKVEVHQKDKEFDLPEMTDDEMEMISDL